ncbi:MAG: hypothetical protein JSS13_01840 [Proteobacteria bacterium]|jgi:hypothetical protein|nr:hypothetical protein [Pseudomonadota bacterium]MCE7951021.1 hypothetical protein [Xanthomonadales bacterium PRO7]HMM58010.1 hypothetical protein [Rudaea sp.]
MSNAIGFLENVGRNAALRHATREQLLHAMRTNDVEQVLRDAMLQGTPLAALLGAREVMFSPNQRTPKPAAKKPAKKAPAKKPAKKAPAKRK